MFSSSEPVAACSDCRLLGTLCWISLVRPAHAVPENGPKTLALAIDFAVKTFDYRLEQPSERLPDDKQGLKLGLKLELCCLANKLYRFYRLRNHSINCVEFEFFLSPLLMPNLSQVK